MFHVNKGVMGIRVDGVSGMWMSNCSLSNIENVGSKGSLICGNYISSHPNQGPLMFGYTGAETFGIVLSDIEFSKTSAMLVESQ